MLDSDYSFKSKQGKCKFDKNKVVAKIQGHKRLAGEDERNAYNATDRLRLDGHKGHICCSIEYPNAWYFERLRADDDIFRDWVVLLVDPAYLGKTTTLFSPRNAAAGYGASLAAGLEGFDALYASTVVGQGGVNRRRPDPQIPACPTDQQAEVLVEDRIEMADILAVAVRDGDQAQTERVRLKINGIDPNLFTFVAAPTMFKKYDLSAAIQRGVRPAENTLPPFVDRLQNG